MKTNEELNAAVARAMGWRFVREYEGVGPVYKSTSGNSYILHKEVAFSQSLDAFLGHVLPELERRGKMEAWARKVARRVGICRVMDDHDHGWCVASPVPTIAKCILPDPRVLCETALAVMGGE